MKIKKIVQQIKEAKGAGDLVAIVAEPIKKELLEHTPSETIRRWIENCKCTKRKEFLNKHFPLK